MITLALRRRAFIAIITYYSTLDLKATIIVQIWGGNFIVCALEKGYVEEARHLLEVTHNRIFVDDHKIIKGWCNLSFVGSLQWFERFTIIFSCRCKAFRWWFTLCVLMGLGPACRTWSFVSLSFMLVRCRSPVIEELYFWRVYFISCHFFVLFCLWFSCLFIWQRTTRTFSWCLIVGLLSRMSVVFCKFIQK